MDFINNKQTFQSAICDDRVLNGSIVIGEIVNDVLHVRNQIDVNEFYENANVYHVCQVKMIFDNELQVIEKGSYARVTEVRVFAKYGNYIRYTQIIEGFRLG